MRKLLLLTMIFLMFACQENKRPYPLQMQKAEKMLAERPAVAVRMLDSIRSTIKYQSMETQRYYDLLLFRAHEKSYYYLSHNIPNNTYDTIQKCITYYTDNFNNDKLMAAYHCMGCFYYYKNDKVKASLFEQKALNYASQSNNYSLIGGIYRKMGYIAIDIPKESVLLFKKSAVFYAKAKDSLALMYSQRDIAMAFNPNYSNDSAVYYGEKAYRMAQSIKDSTAIQIIGCQLATYYLSVNKIDQAKYLLNQTLLNLSYKDYSCLYYYNWGTYYKAVGNYNASIYYYDKCLQIAKDLNFRYISFIALYSIFKKENDFKNSIVCSDSIIKINDEKQLAAHDSEITKQSISFGVRRVEKENNILNETIASRNSFIIGLIIIFILFVVVGLRIVKNKELYRRKNLKKKMRDEMSNTNNAVIDERIKEINDLEEKLKGANEEVERQEYKLKLLPKKEELVAQKEKNKAIENEFFTSTIYGLVFNKINNGKTITDSQWIEFKDAINQIYDKFNYRLKAIYPQMSEQEIRICNLIKVGFSAEQMAAALNCTLSNTYSIRRRLYKKLTAVSGSAGDLDKWIAEF